MLCERRFFGPRLGDFVKSFLIILVLISIYFPGTCRLATARDEGEPLPCDYKKMGLDAAKFYIYLTQDTPYQSWAAWPETRKLSTGKAPHGAYVTTYVNPAARRSIETKEGMAFGSLIVTENFDADKKPTGLMVMLKIKGYNPRAGDWHWFHYDSRGTVIAAGRLETCVNCHRAGKDNDFLMTSPVRR